MWRLLKHLGSECWGDHDWIYRTNARGLWLECRRCGHESNGVELMAPRYRRTQDGADDAHRLGGMPPAAARAARGAAHGADAQRFGVPRPSRRASDHEPAGAMVTTEAERRWLQAWRGLSADERQLVERMMAGLSATRSTGRAAVLEPAFAARERQGREPLHAEGDRGDRMVG